MFVRRNEVRKLAPIAVEILCQSQRVGKDWNEKRGAHFQIAYRLATNFLTKTGDCILRYSFWVHLLEQALKRTLYLKYFYK